MTLVIITMDELLKWKPPKPSIDIDDVREIEKFLFGPSSIDHDLVSYHTCTRGTWDCQNDTLLARGREARVLRLVTGKRTVSRILVALLLRLREQFLLQVLLWRMRRQSKQFSH